MGNLRKLEEGRVQALLVTVYSQTVRTWTVIGLVYMRCAQRGHSLPAQQSPERARVKPPHSDPLRRRGRVRGGRRREGER